MPRAIAKISGGTGSWCAADAYQRRTGQRVEALFTDVLMEDQDAYRFLIAGVAVLHSVTLPKGALPEIGDFPAWEDRDAYKEFVLDLADRTRHVLPGLHWISDGRDPWDVFEAERFLGNSSADPCSKILKRHLSDRWLRDHCDPAETVAVVGIDHEEIERFEGAPARGARPEIKGLRRRMAEAGWTFVAPLCEPPYSSWLGRRNRVFMAGLWLPRLNALGFSHNNCGGACCKAGQGMWKLMLQAFPERYAYAEQREAKIRSVLGDVSMLTDRRGKGKKPLTLETLRTRDLTRAEASEMGGCGCFFGDAA